MALEEIVLTTENQQVITTEQAWAYRIIPINQIDQISKFWVSDKQEIEQVKLELELLFNKKIELEVTKDSNIQAALSKYYRQNENNSQEKKTVVGSSKSIDFLQNLILEAKELRSSDIHIESYEEKCRVRIRIDGQLIEKYIIDKVDYPGLVNKIKIQAKLDISEKRLPQDGRILFEIKQTKFDIRVSILPTLFGEKIVLRILSNDATNINIESLGFGEVELKNYLEGIKKPNGILLISGPTGSGKTTTLYATLKILNKEKTNILTVEDPIEYTLEGINQVQLKETIGLTFSKALKTFLRQDPDIIMLGEIRDGETAQMAIRAALTGHLVLSTIHTNSAWGTVSRLIDMGVEPFLLAGTLNTTVAQRLVRVLCPNCKTVEKFDSVYYPPQYRAPKILQAHARPTGCENCHYTGYKGRLAIYEVIPIDFELSELIRNRQLNVRDQLKERRIRSLEESAFELLESQVTSIDEVYSLLSNNL